MSRKHMWMVLGLGMMLAISGVARGEAAAPPQAPSRAYTGQVREINIDHCDLQPGTCMGSLVLAQAGDQEVTLTIPAGTILQRGDEHVHLEQLGIGNYVMVQAARVPSNLDDTLGFGLEQKSEIGDRVGTSAGERPYTLHESSDE